MASSGTVFVTVGTTRFDALIRALDTPQTILTLSAKSFTKLVIQLGAGTYTPTVICPAGRESCTHANGFQVQWFRFAPALGEQMQAASLIISHAGSGSLFEALQLRKALIAVPNSILMANHQAELAHHLEVLGHLIASSPEELVDTLGSMQLCQLRPYTPGDATNIVRAIDKLMGFHMG